MTRPHSQLLRLREEAGWNQSTLVDRLHEAAIATNAPPAQVDKNTISRWERGVRRPGAYYTRLLCHVFDVSAAELGFARKEADVPADSSDLGPEDATFELARSATAGLDEGSIGAAHVAAHRLCRAYSGTPPGDLVPQVQRQLRQLHHLLAARLDMRQQQQLLADAAWLHLLLSAAHNDLGQRDAAWASRDAALALGEEAGDGDVVAWAYETPSWFAITDRRAGDALDYATTGRQLAPEGSSGWIMNQLKIVQAHARLGQPLPAERELERARTMLLKLPEPEYPDHHFVFDPPKLRFYEGTAYAWLGMPKQAETSAREVIRTASDPNTRNWVPTRVAFSRLDLADALLRQGRIDEAGAEAALVFDTFLRRDTLVRAGELDAQLTARYPHSPEAAQFRERYLAALQALPTGRY